MSLTNVLLIHVSSRYMPRNDVEERAEQEKEYYAILDLPKYAPIADIRKSYRRITLKIQCDRMMLEWNAPTSPEEGGGGAAGGGGGGVSMAVDAFQVEAHQKATAALEEHETMVKEAFHVLGDKHLRQQYHLLQCRPSRYKMIKGPLAIIHGLTLSRRWFPLLVLQSVIVATMVNAVVAQYETQEWVYVLIPVFGYYGLIVLFWLFMLEFPWRRHCTKRSFGAMLCAFLQHACLFNGCFWMARHWDRSTGSNINWYILSIPFYLAILFRCCCTLAAVASLHDLQSKMISRVHLEEKNQQLTVNSNEPDNLKESSALPSGYIVVTQDSSLFTGHLLKLSLNDDDVQDLKLVEAARVETSPEYRQVDHAAKSLHRAAIQLATLGTAFVTLVALKLEDQLDITWWLIFAPVWIHLAMRLFVTSRAPNRVPPGSTSNNNAATTTTSTTNNINNNHNNNNNNPQSPAATEAFNTLMNNSTHTTSEQSTDGTGTTKPNTTEEISGNASSDSPVEVQQLPLKTMDVASKSLWKGEYTAVDVVMDVPTQSMTNDDTRDVEEASSALNNNGTTDSAPPADDETKKAPEQSLVDTVQLALTAEERDVEAALPLTTTTTMTPTTITPQTNSFDSLDAVAATPGNNGENDDDNETTNNAAATSDGQDGGPAVHEEFERWQSVYENQEVRSGHFQFLPCEVFFHLLIVCLIVAKLDESHENTSPEGSSFNAFYILLVPFSVGLLVCCCALVAGFLALNTEAPPTDGDVDADGEGNAAFDANADSDELPPMQAGAKDLAEKTFSTHIDAARPDLTFSQRVQVLTSSLPITTTEAEAWLVENDVQFLRSPKTIWEQVVNCANGLNCETVSQDDNIVDIGSFDKECIMLLRENLEAHFHKTKFQNELNAIEPAEEDETGDETGGGIECLVCCEDYDIKDMVHCEGDPIHFFCRGCFYRYATETIQAGDVAGMPCAHANCAATFSTPTVTSNLSQWELLRKRDRENERNQKVALAAKAVLQCTCGAVGIVTEDQVGDGCIICPGEGCDKKFCALCGNLWHPDTSCPPTKKMLQWVVQNTMPCPNCRTPIEKNYGCDHMHCAPPGGCGHHFSYRTGKPMSKHGRNLRGLYH